MSKYDKSSITTLASIAVGVSDAITFIATSVPALALAGIVYSPGNFYKAGRYFEALWDAFKDTWIVVIPACALSGGLGYLLTILLRVAGQLLLCLVEIEENTRPTKTS